MTRFKNYSIMVVTAAALIMSIAALSCAEKSEHSIALDKIEATIIEFEALVDEMKNDESIKGDDMETMMKYNNRLTSIMQKMQSHTIRWSELEESASKSELKRAKELKERAESIDL